MAEAKVSVYLTFRLAACMERRRFCEHFFISRVDFGERCKALKMLRVEALADSGENERAQALRSRIGTSNLTLTVPRTLL